MATNVYFSGKVRSEQHLYEDLIIESVKMYGQDVYYLPREVVSIDNILNEDIESNYDTAYTIEMYIEGADGFAGEGDILQKFGIEVRDQATFIVSKRRWEQLVGVNNNGINSSKPTEGDLIYLPLSKSVFEVRFVEHELPFYQLQNLPVYKLQCELFEYSGESINTGNGDLDSINAGIAAQLTLIINNTNNTDFIINENVQQEITLGSGEYVTGRVVTKEIIDVDNTKITLTDWATTDGLYHNFNNTTPIEGLTSGAIWDVSEVYDINSVVTKNAFSDEPYADNQVFEQAGDSIIDFSETNPFGDL
tara:strand:- start:3268 stop:4185 length:918 start_codon:yes stop_codon:yes gene_type:complete